MKKFWQPHPASLSSAVSRTEKCPKFHVALDAENHCAIMTHSGSPAALTVGVNSILLRAKGETQDNSFVATRTRRHFTRRAVPALLMTNLLKVRDIFGGIPHPRKPVWTTPHCSSYCFSPPSTQYQASRKDLPYSGHLDSAPVSGLPEP